MQNLQPGGALGGANLASQAQQRHTTQLDELEKNLSDLHEHLKGAEDRFGAHLLPEQAMAQAGSSAGLGTAPEPVRSSHNMRLAQCNYSVQRLIAELKSLCLRYEG